MRKLTLATARSANGRVRPAYGVPCLLFLLVLSVLCGCGLRHRSYDRPPKRSLVEDRWPGYYFDEVHATFSLPLFNPDTSLSRATGDAFRVVSNDPRAPKYLPNAATVRPTQAVLVKSGSFRVDSEEHFYGRADKVQLGHNQDNPVDVEIAIEGPSPDAKVSKSIGYNNVSFLYELAERAWPGVG